MTLLKRFIVLIELSSEVTYFTGSISFQLIFTILLLLQVIGVLQNKVRKWNFDLLRVVHYFLEKVNQLDVDSLKIIRVAVLKELFFQITGPNFRDLLIKEPIIDQTVDVDHSRFNLIELITVVAISKKDKGDDLGLLYEAGNDVTISRNNFPCVIFGPPQQVELSKDG